MNPITKITKIQQKPAETGRQSIRNQSFPAARRSSLDFNHTSRDLPAHTHWWYTHWHTHMHTHAHPRTPTHGHSSPAWDKVLRHSAVFSLGLAPWFALSMTRRRMRTTLLGGAHRISCMWWLYLSHKETRPHSYKHRHFFQRHSLANLGVDAHGDSRTTPSPRAPGTGR